MLRLSFKVGDGSSRMLTTRATKYGEGGEQLDERCAGGLREPRLAILLRAAGTTPSRIAAAQRVGRPLRPESIGAAWWWLA